MDNNEKKFRWDVELRFYGHMTGWRTVYTETEDWYEAEGKLLALPGVWDLADHFICTRPDGTQYYI